MADPAARLVDLVWADPNDREVRAEVERRIEHFQFDLDPPGTLANLLLAKAHILAKADLDLEGAERVVDRGLSLGQEFVEPRTWIRLLNYAGFLFSVAGRFADATRPLIAALRGSIQAGIEREGFLAASNLASVIHELGDPQAALEILDAPGKALPTEKDSRLEFLCCRLRILMSLGEAASLKSTIKQLETESEDTRGLGDRSLMVLEAGLAEAARHRGRPRQARRLATRALSRQPNSLEPRDRLRLHETIAFCALSNGDLEAASVAASSSLDLIRNLHTTDEVRALQTCARVAMATGDRARCEQLSVRAQNAKHEQAASATSRLVFEYAQRYLRSDERQDVDLGSGLEALRRTQRELERTREVAEGSARRLRAITDAIPVHIAHLDSAATIRFANRSLLEDFGLEEEEILEASAYRVFDSDALRPILDGLGRALRGETSVNVYALELRVGTRELEVTWTPGASGRGAYLVTRDITAQRERERLEKQLLRAQKVESLGALASGIAHDFNNLLTSMLANLSLVDEDPGHPEAREAIQDAIEATKRAASLTKQLLDYTGKVRNRPTPTNINSMVESTCGLIQSTVRQNATICFDLDAESPFAMIDEDQISRVVMNLVLNACEAQSEDCGTIVIRTGSMTHDGSTIPFSHPDTPLAKGEYAWVEVEDDGIGMSADQLRRLFDPFFTTKTTGRGLGLAASLGIVKSHRGRMTVESAEGIGTTIRLLLPRCAEETLIPQPQHTRPQRCSRVLLIDDDEDVRTAVRRSVESLGLLCREASDGPTGLDVFEREGPFDLVLLDLTMAKMHGAEVLSELRKRSRVRIALISGYSQTGAQRLLGEHGANDFLQKPICREDIQALIFGSAQTAQPHVHHD